MKWSRWSAAQPASWAICARAETSSRPWHRSPTTPAALLTIDSTFTPPPLMRPLEHGADLVYALAHEVLQRSRRRDGRVRRNRGPRSRRGGAHRSHVACRRRHLAVQRLAHHAVASHHLAAQAPAAVRERPGHRRVPSRGPRASPTSPTRGSAAMASTPQRPPSSGAGSAESVASPSPAADKDRVRFVNDLRVITSAVSLGHDETLVAYEQYAERPLRRVRPRIPGARPDPARHRPRGRRGPDRRPRHSSTTAYGPTR